MSQVCEPALRGHGPHELCRSTSTGGWDVPPLCANPKPKLQMLCRMERGLTTE